MRDTEESPEEEVADISARLLGWYDRHAREMPWRVGPADRRAGVRPDPYRVWLSEIMLQQTTVAAVRSYFRRFTERWPDVGALAAAEDAEVMAEWAGLGYYARARNLLRGARAVVADHGGRFPETRDGLLTLPGVGPYTAAAVAAIAFDEPATVVDGNVERVVARLFRVETPLPAAKPALTRLAAAITPQERPGDHAQAMMDLGATICTPRKPVCSLCPLGPDCAARRDGLEVELPRKAPKAVKPVREGTLWIAVRADGALLLETRPETGMLGGMLGWPGTDWDRSGGPTDPPIAADWRATGVEVRHTFSHFHLRLSVLLAEVAQEAVPARGSFVPHERFRPSSLPTVMQKAWNVAAAAIRHPRGEARLD
ncbi:A/G-specific adenine glycosylase [Cereibacter azotoformans]|uniref:Adenine DNA glycosylase n=1 Tax=Cereibacter azotoformans TaxID=43057 RepID=A0A2T5KE88_9RHOB|nr:A/G-specific adenine glycosylase [Cereibacter azotoformans]AXQ92391.1 A/G-specific adenine glycosylase [Cereibacter sphaeroides]MBO4170041.1 A/G-specific adenine glycosylase [Cereibacter azotoformans]PTR20696.1 A/G-specific DNA-adenine glycosylase [Cereibacter azotoformans]UIJ30661.1 A/G-specific adenine glycosylase [Cereibacter azotoformans]